MKYSVLFLASLTRLAAANCAGDNCNRAITGTAFGTAILSSHLADCSSFFSVTVTPAPTSTTTGTTWNPATLPPKRGKLARSANLPITQTASLIPSYASTACDGNATPVPVRYSSACSCAHVTPATTTLPTPIATVTVNLAGCTNYGLQFAAYPYIAGSTYDPTTYKLEVPEVSGVTTTYSYSTDNTPSVPQSVYGSTPIAVDFVALDHRGFFIADQSGTYNVEPPAILDWLTLWIGPSAFSGWTLDNALFSVQSQNRSGNQYTIDLEMGIYPIRFMWVNDGSPRGLFDFLIRAPDGTIVESWTQGSSYFVTGCAATNTPLYPAWGAET